MQTLPVAIHCPNCCGALSPSFSANLLDFCLPLLSVHPSEDDKTELNNKLVPSFFHKVLQKCPMNFVSLSETMLLGKP
jgi:hypothetical protein